jgi:hypothetical protein
MSNKSGRLKRRLEGLSTPPHEIRKRTRVPKLVFGDRVQVRATEEATAAGVAGLAGEIIGFTRRSGASVAVIGATGDDYAFNVSFKETESTSWLAEDQLELLERSPGAGGKKEREDPATAHRKKPSWKFW